MLAFGTGWSHGLGKGGAPSKLFFKKEKKLAGIRTGRRKEGLYPEGGREGGGGKAVWRARGERKKKKGEEPSLIWGTGLTKLPHYVAEKTRDPSVGAPGKKEVEKKRGGTDAQRRLLVSWCKACSLIVGEEREKRKKMRLRSRRKRRLPSPEKKGESEPTLFVPARRTGEGRERCAACSKPVQKEEKGKGKKGARSLNQKTPVSHPSRARPARKKRRKGARRGRKERKRAWSPLLDR